jgi:hypothetical protein
MRELHGVMRLERDTAHLLKHLALLFDKIHVFKVVLVSFYLVLVLRRF